MTFLEALILVFMVLAGLFAIGVAQEIRHLKVKNTLKK
jgi:hypothetical protein